MFYEWPNYLWNYFQQTGDVEAYLLAKELQIVEASDEIGPEIDKIFDAFDNSIVEVAKKDECSENKGDNLKK